MFVAMLALSGKLPAIAVGLALLLVSAAAITLAAGNSDLANLIVTYAFGFFAAGAVLCFIRYIMELRAGSEKIEKNGKV